LAEDGEVAPFPVVMLTGSGNERVAAEAIRAGAANYIVKAQFTPTSLAHVIDQAMERVQSHRELVALRNAVLAQTEQEIEETEARWRALADLLPHGVLVVQDGVIRQANAAAATLMGYSDANGPIGHSWDYRLPANERGLIREAWDRGGSPIRVCHYLLRTDRTLVPVEQLTAAIRYHERPAHQVLLSPAEQPLGAEHDAPGTVREGQTVTQSNG
ncbi:MAG: PAS domain-containing protein, partial [Bacteroidota bacterium]